MHTRRDQVEAHTFVANRMRSALLRAEPDLPRPPLRRTPAGIVVGSALAALLVGGAAVLALFRPVATQGWKRTGTLIVEQGTGSRFVLAGGRLFPILNYASARLLLGASMKVAEAPPDELSGIPHGPQLGIPWAPDTLPPPGAAGGHTWLACAGSIKHGSTTSPGVELLLDPDVIGQDAPAHAAVIVRDTSGDTFLVADGHRWRLAAPWVGRALGADPNAVYPVRGGWLDTLSQGPDLGPLRIPGRGRPGPVLGGHATRIGDVVTASSVVSGDRYYLVVAGGLMPIGTTAAALALGDPAAASSGRPVQFAAAALVSTPIVPATPALDALPATPRFLPIDPSAQVPCVRLDTAGSAFRSVLVIEPVDAITAAAPAALGVTVSTRTADRVAVPAGGGMLARAAPSPGVSTGALVLITQDGTQYPVANDDAAIALGYQPADAAPVPPAVLALLPTGPRLSVIGGEAPPQ